MIDRILRKRGQTVTIRKVTDPVYDVNDVLDESASTIQTTDVPAVISRPEEGDDRRMEGRVEQEAKWLTVPSDTDIEVVRNGVNDEVIVNGETYRVQSVEHTTHPFTSVEKKTAYIVRKGGH